MTYLGAIILIAIILVVVGALLWGVPFVTRERPHNTFITATAPLPIWKDFSGAPAPGSSKENHGGWNNHLNADPALEWWGDNGQLTRARHLSDSGGPSHEGFSRGGSKEHHGGWNNHLNADPTLEWWGDNGQLTRARHLSDAIGPSREGFSRGKKERYGEPPGMIRAVHHNELGFRGWADMPGDYEGSSAASVSAYIERSA